MRHISLASIKMTNNKIVNNPIKKVYSAIASKDLALLTLEDLMERNEQITLIVNIITIREAN